LSALVGAGLEADGCVVVVEAVAELTDALFEDGERHVLRKHQAVVVALSVTVDEQIVARRSDNARLWRSELLVLGFLSLVAIELVEVHVAEAAALPGHAAAPDTSDRLVIICIFKAICRARVVALASEVRRSEHLVLTPLLLRFVHLLAELLELFEALLEGLELGFFLDLHNQERPLVVGETVPVLGSPRLEREAVLELTILEPVGPALSLHGPQQQHHQPPRGS